MIAIPQTETERIARELRQEQLIKLARNIEDEFLTRAEQDYKICIHNMALEIAKRRMEW